MLRPNGEEALNDLCLHCEKPSCPGICDELRETMGEVTYAKRGATITWHGLTRKISEWAEVFGMTSRALYKRLEGKTDAELILTELCERRAPGSVPPERIEQTYIRLSTMHADYELYWKRLEISEGSAGLVARYGAVQSAPTGKTSDPVARRAMPELTISDEALERRSWIACVLYMIEYYRHQTEYNSRLKSRLLEMRAIDGLTMRLICKRLNDQRGENEREVSVAYLRRYFERIVNDVALEATRRGLFRATQK